MRKLIPPYSFVCLIAVACVNLLAWCGLRYAESQVGPPGGISLDRYLLGLCCRYILSPQILLVQYSAAIPKILTIVALVILAEAMLIQMFLTLSLGTFRRLGILPHKETTPRADWQFGLQRCFVVVTFCCLIFALVANRQLRKSRCEAYANQWKKLGICVNTSAARDDEVTRMSSSWGLETLPRNLENFRNLDELRLERCDIVLLPPEIGTLSRLRRLDLESNGIAELPPEVGNLKKLEFLDVRSNRLTSLPGSIGDLTRLKKLLASDNKISSLPATMKHLENLEFLALDGTQINDNDLEHLKALGNLKHLLIYRTKVTKEGVESLRQALPGCRIRSD
jgi:hypothetical protein